MPHIWLLKNVLMLKLLKANFPNYSQYLQANALIYVQAQLDLFK